MKYIETAKRIRLAMEEVGLSQQELAEQSHIGKSSISHYVNGSNQPGNKHAYLLAQVLKVNPPWLMGLDAPKTLSQSMSNVSPHSPEEIEKALKLYEQYKKAIPPIQSAVESLLKADRPDP